MTKLSLDNDSLFLHAFNHAAIGMAIVSLNGEFRKVNPALCRQTGYSESELLTKLLADITHPDDIAYGVAMRARLVAGEQDFYQHEKRYIRKDGVHYWVHLSISIVRDAANIPLFFVAQMQDISDRKRAEHLLKSHMQQYRSLVDENPDLVYAVTLDGEVASINASVERITGYTAEEWIAGMPAPLMEGLRQALEHTNEGSWETFRLEATISRKDGRTVHLDVTHVPIIVDGEAIGIYGIAKDMSKQVKLMHRLSESENKYRLLAEHSLDMIVRLSPFGVFIYASASSIAVLGYEPEELIGVDAASLVHPDDAPSFAAAHSGRREPLPDERVAVFRCRKKTGDYIWIESRTKTVRMRRSGNITEYIAVYRDVTEREAERARLREVEELYRLIADNARDIIMVADGGGVIRYMSPAARNVLGREPESFVGTRIMEHFHPEDAAAICRRSLSDEDVYWGRMLHQSGGYVWMETAVKLIRNESGGVDRILGVSRDISDRKRAERELKESEERYRHIVEHSPDGIMISVEGKLVFVNETTVELLGAGDKRRLIGLDPIMLVHPEFRDMSTERMNSVLRDRRVAELVEFRIVRLDGRIIDVESKSLPTVYHNADAVHTIIRDITDRKKTQELMKQSEQLSAAGQLAAGIAHEIRNPLTSLKGFLHLIRDGRRSKPDYFQIMHEELNRIESILGELLLLAKPNAMEMELVPLRSVVDGVVKLLETHAHLKSIALELSLTTCDPLAIYGDASHLKQVFINLVKNAMEAMPCGGVIRIEAEEAAGAAVIRVVDSGHGIPKERLPFIGRPFFTTKEYGTGLGLSVSYNIVRAHRGSIDIDSEPGRGTTFTVKLPLWRRERDRRANRL